MTLGEHTLWQPSRCEWAKKRATPLECAAASVGPPYPYALERTAAGETESEEAAEAGAEVQGADPT
eukprot:359938-Chlamydomonas_euryale.AAC.4